MQTIIIRPIDSTRAPEHLLLEADPSVDRIRRYLDVSECFAALLGDEIVGVCVISQHDEASAEVMNIAVDPLRQDRGIGTTLLHYCILEMKRRRCDVLTLGTGCFGDQLVFYHKLGFRVCGVIRDFFVDNYELPVVEFGIRHRDMLRLELSLDLFQQARA